MTKSFSVNFEINAKLLALLYICYEYKFPLSFMLSFYEMYGDNSLFVLKAISCVKKIKITDSVLINAIEESRKLAKEIARGISVILKVKQLENIPLEKRVEPIPEYPSIDVSLFTDSYKKFIENYLLINIDNIYDQKVNLKLNTRDLYEEPV